MEMRRYKEKKNRRHSEESKRRRQMSSHETPEGPSRKVAKLTQGLPAIVDTVDDDIDMDVHDRLASNTEETTRPVSVAGISSCVVDEDTSQNSPVINILGMRSRCVDELDTIQKPLRDKMRLQA